MPCYHPVEVSISRKSNVSIRRIKDMQVVPCGNCLGCRMEQARQWTVRILHEKQMHPASWFVTLTYDDERIPQNGSLDSTHFSGFIKALRRHEAAKTVSYYGCGEYGDRSERPHYHAVLFGPQFLDKCFHRTSNSGPVWRSQALETDWNFGISEFGALTEKSAAYVAGYVRKKVSNKVNPNHYLRYDDNGEILEIEKEFARMSLKPAIGKRWIEKYWKDVYPRDKVVVGGWEAKPPRYYDKWLEDNHPEMAMEVRAKRLAEAEELSDYTLNAKEVAHTARIGLFNERKAI